MCSHAQSIFINTPLIFSIQSQYEEVPDSALKSMDQNITELNERLKGAMTANGQLDSSKCRYF